MNDIQIGSKICIQELSFGRIRIARGVDIFGYHRKSGNFQGKGERESSITGNCRENEKCISLGSPPRKCGAS